MIVRHVNATGNAYKEDKVDYQKSHEIGRDWIALIVLAMVFGYGGFGMGGMNGMGAMGMFWPFILNIFMRP